MSSTDVKQFVVRHVFINVLEKGKAGRKDRINCRQTFFNIPWFVTFRLFPEHLSFGLACLKVDKGWFVEADITVKLTTDTDKFAILEGSHRFCHGSKEANPPRISCKDLENYLVDESLAVELQVIIKRSSGVKTEKLKTFDIFLPRANIILKVDDEEFHVNKNVLARHSSYFRVMLRNSHNSKIRLEKVNRWDLQNYLELIYGVSQVQDDSLEGILKLAHMWNSETAKDQCVQFLKGQSKQSSLEKLGLTIKYGIEDMKNDMLSKITTQSQLIAMVPGDFYDLEDVVKKEVLKKALSFRRNAPRNLFSMQ